MSSHTDNVLVASDICTHSHHLSYSKDEFAEEQYDVAKECEVTQHEELLEHIHIPGHSRCILVLLEEDFQSCTVED